MYRVLKPYRIIIALTVLLSGILLMALISPASKREGQHVKTIVIDAGHGGKDPGTQSGGVREKDVTLSIALKLGKKLKDSIPGVKIYYTRMNDNFIELVERGSIANRNKADLFISIHCNHNGKTHIHGTETYVMGLHKNESNLQVAKRENEAILLEQNIEEGYEGFDPHSPEAHIIFSFYQSAFLEQSLMFAGHIEKRFAERPKINVSRGVKQAGFLVLWKTAMPSVLIETGFISNLEERKYLGSPAGQEEVAESIYKAINDYIVEIKSLN